MASTIKIYHDLPVINQYAQLPPNQERDKSRVTWLEVLAAYGDDAQLVELSGTKTASLQSAQQLVRLPGLEPGVGYGDLAPGKLF